MVLTHVAVGALEQDDFDRAEVHLVESLTLLQGLEEHWQSIQTLEMFACLAAVQGERLNNNQASLLRAARLVGAAEAFLERIGAPAWPF
jgi:hypothetical protein